MKKKIIGTAIGSVAMLIISALAAFGILKLIQSRNVAETGNMLGVDWYNETDTEFTISTVEELQEFVKLSDFYTFKGQTVKLGADLVLNEGNAEDWKENAPKNLWSPISGFAGTFDGQGHSISGMYAKAYESQVAMFINPDFSCTIQNIELVNSYFNTGGFMGVSSFVTGGGGKFIGLYSDAIFDHKGENVGGIASSITKQSTFEECWFDGEINITLRDCGGIIDDINGARVNLRHCLFSGVINSPYDFAGTRTGGLVGMVQKTSALIMQDCLASGKLNPGRETYTGGAIGVSYVESQTTVHDSYVSTDTYGIAVGTANGTWTGTPLLMKSENLIGTKAYEWTTLDFENYWALVEDGTPILKRFADSEVSTAGLKKAFDTSWYNSGQFSFEIKTVEQLYGLYFISAYEDFGDKVVKLGADITLNEGKASDWEKNAPANEWYPIPKFAGTFNGQGHTISGLYVKANAAYKGFIGQTTTTAYIKDLSIKNSLIYNTVTSMAATGSVAGELYGKMENVYSNAIVIAHGSQVGGLVGRTNDNDKDGKEDKVVITNCWFDGSVSLRGEKTMEAGGLVGRMVQGDLDITHCLNTGTVSTEATGTGLHVGGFIGRANGIKLNVSDSLNTGKIVCNYTVCVGSVFGRLPNKTTIATITNTYTTTESYKDAIGNNSKATMNGGVIQLPESWYTGDNAYVYTELDFPNYWALVKNDTPILQSFASSDPSTSHLTKAVDTTWYSADAKEMVIKTPAQLLGFAMKAMGNTFANQTVKLGADIAMNPNLEWISIGTRSKLFYGTFDGQGYTISGINQKSDAQDIGLFGSIHHTAMLKNFRLVDSTFEYYSEAANEKEIKIWIGSVCADFRGDMENVYSNATVISNGSRAGGIAGMPNGVKSNGVHTTSTIKNCWFDGEVRLTGPYARYAGGIAGVIMQGNAEILHCLNTGKVSNERPNAGEFIGGILGSDQNANCNVVIQDCLNVGTVTGKNWNMIGAVLGGTSTSTSNITITNTYALDTSCVNPSGATVLANRYKGTLNDASVALSKAELTGLEPYQWTMLDFENYWAAIANGTPELKTFSTGMSTAGVDKKYDISWYNTKDKKFTITTEEQLYGLAMLSGSNTFKGQTFELGGKIDMSSYPKWTSIGNAASPFEGTFDGKSFEISGMTQKTASSYAGLIGYMKNATVQNVIIKDSTFESTAAENAFIGGIVGGGSGKLYDSYSNASVVSTGVGVGGLVGRSTGMDIKGCWYDGAITVDYTGKDSAQVGGLVGTGATAKTTIDNSAFTGSVDVTFTSTNEGQETWRGRIGTLVGADGKAELVITNAMASGTLNVDWLHNDETGSTKPSKTVNTGTIVGYVENKATKYSEEVYSSVTGSIYIEDTNKSTSIAAGNIAEESLLGVEAYRYTGLDFTSAEKYWAARTAKVPGIAKFVDGALDVSQVIIPDTSWYDDNEDEFHIINEEQFYGFTKLVSQGKSFSGKIVYLDEDIELNKVEDGTLDAWKAGTKTPDNPWSPIGRNTATAFRGTFDGQMHEISGLYFSIDGQNTGLFGYVLDANIKNMKLVDSVFINCTDTKNAFLGSVVGGGRGELSNIYSKVTLQSTGIIVGGMVGRSTGFDISGCWYDGDISVDYKIPEIAALYVGGLVGLMAGKTTTITNCLYTGNIDAAYTSPDGGQTGYHARVGGAVGADGDSASNSYLLTITDTIIAGTVDFTWKHNEETGTVAGRSFGKVGAIVGHVFNTSTKYSYNVYSTVTGETYLEDADAEGTVAGNTDPNTILGSDGYEKTFLDFKEYWAARAGKIPALKKFVPVGEQVAVNTDIIRPDTRWYDGSGTYYIGTEEELYGFNELQNDGNVFSGATICLTADIALNKVEEGTLAAWESKGTDGKPDQTKAPVNQWIPYGNNKNQFAGTFDGCGYTISGLYVNSIKSHAGLFGAISTSGTVRNLSLVDSYIYTSSEPNNIEQSVDGNIDNYAYAGSIAGECRGKLENVYSNATVETIAPRVGGIVGVANDTDSTAGTDRDVDILKCWFDGRLIMTASTTKDGGRYGGGVVGHVMQKGVNISNCLFTGYISSNHTNNEGIHIGGIMGQNQNAAQVVITDCLSAGSIDITNYSCAGSIVGYAAAKTTSGVATTYEITDSYGIKETWKNNQTAEAPTVGNNAVKVSPSGTPVSLNSIKGSAATGVLTGLDFVGNWTVRDGKVPGLKVIMDAANRFKPDVTWFDGSSTTYTLTTPSQLMGVATLSDAGETFKGITIKLGNDLVFNQVEDGTVAAWVAGTKVPMNEWTPIGQTTAFNGTFDGNNRTISGLYFSVTKANAGLFGQTGASSIIKNVRLTDSYMNSKVATADANFGSMIGTGEGELLNCYSNATLQGAGVGIGGLVGISKGMNITSCWYAGTATVDFMDNAACNLVAKFGGLVGTGSTSETVISTCLFDGSMTMNFSRPKTSSAWGSRIGGIAGGDGGVKMQINNTISAGTVIGNWVGNSPDATAAGIIRINSVIGWIQKNSTTTNGNVYSASDVRTYYNNNGTMSLKNTVTDSYSKNVTVTFATDSTVSKTAMVGAGADTLTKLPFSRAEGDTTSPIWYAWSGIPVPETLKDVVE